MFVSQQIFYCSKLKSIFPTTHVLKVGAPHNFNRSDRFENFQHVKEYNLRSKGKEFFVCI